MQGNADTLDNKRRVKILIRVVQVLLWLALTRLCAYSALHGENMTLSIFGSLDFAFILFPYLLLGGLYGYVISYISFLISFVIAIIFEMETAYCMAVFLTATTCFALFAQYFFFKTVKKTLIASVVTLFATSTVEFWCFTALAASDFNMEAAKNYPLFFAKEVVTIFGIAFLLYLFYKKAPDIIKMVFPIGYGYTDAFMENSDIQKSIRKTKLSVKITAIIIGIEVILGISVAVFMVVLFPDMKDMMVNNIRDQKEFITRNAQQLDRDSIIQSIEDMRFVMDDFALTYDIKMVLLMLCVGVPLGGIANYYTKTTVGGPLGALSDFMNEYAGADDDEKLLVGEKVDKIRALSKDEIMVVCESTKTMVHSIEDYIERTKQEQQLKLDLEVAQKASEAKSSFLSNMSHEIRTPINAVLGMNEMILRENSDPQIEEYAQNVKSAGNSLLGIVNDILDFSKIEAGKMDILNVEYHLSSMINDLLNMISVKADDKGLEVVVNVDEKTPDKLFGDEVRIKQCVTNILSNAVKYTDKGSVTLNVGFRPAEDDNIFLSFQVVDTGIGIKEEDLSKLFSPFERIEEIRNRSIEGTGLGMSIVKKLLALMDTKLVVKSEYGKGSDFSFEVKQKVESFEEIGDFKEKYKLYLKSLKKYHESFTAPDAEILVVDDTAINLTVVKGLLKSTLVKVDTAESGKETLMLVTKKKYDAIFIDHRMPEMDGLETLAAMKELEDNLNMDTPCIALTANAGSGARDEYIAAGFDDYLSKPVDGKVLEKMLMDYLPEEKIQIASEANASKEAVKEPEPSDAGQSAGDFLDKLTDIDLDEALTNCGSREILMDVVKEFLISIDKKSGDIESFARDKDFRNYTVAVHALKSSARLVGATKLSKDAAYLEKCGNDENAAEIYAKTPDLLALYRSYKDKLSAANEEETSDEDKEPISEDELESAFSDMKELLEAYDFDTADGIMDMLEGYRIPDSKKDKFLKIKELMAAVDRDALIELL